MERQQMNFEGAPDRGNPALQQTAEPDAVEFARARLSFDPDPVQELVLRSESTRGILNCTRQWGKSTVTAAKAVHRAFTRANSLILVAGPSGRQSSEFVRKAATFMHRLNLPVRGDGDNPHSLAFPNGSRIIGIPESEGTVRGFSAVSMLIIDEAARVGDTLYKALRPMLGTSNGDLWLMSTPFERQGFFWETWEHGGERWDRVRVPATECPRLSPEFLEEERETLGTAWFRQEYMAEFMDIGCGLFDRDLVEAALDPTLTGLDLGMRSR